MMLLWLMKEMFSPHNFFWVTNLSVIRHKVESNSGRYKKTKHAKFLEKQNTCTYQGVRNACFSKNFTCFVFLWHPFWGSSLSPITGELGFRYLKSDAIALCFPHELYFVFCQIVAGYHTIHVDVFNSNFFRIFFKNRFEMIFHTSSFSNCNSVHPLFLANPKPNFQKWGAWQDPQLWEGVAGKEEGDVFQGGLQFWHKK